MSVGDAYNLCVVIAAPDRDVSGTAHSESKARGLAREGGIRERSRCKLMDWKVKTLGSTMEMPRIIIFECKNDLKTLSETSTCLI